MINGPEPLKLTPRLRTLKVFFLLSVIIFVLASAASGGPGQEARAQTVATEVKYDVRFRGQFDGAALAGGVAVPTDAGFSEVMIVAHNRDVPFWSEGGTASLGRTTW